MLLLRDASKNTFFNILLQVSVRPDMYAEFSCLFLPAAILCTLRNSCHWLGKLWFVPMKCLKTHKIRSQLTNLFATKGRFPEKKRPYGKIQNSSKDDRRWNALLWGTGFPRLQSKHPCKSSLLWLAKSRFLKSAPIQIEKWPREIHHCQRRQPLEEEE